MAFPALRRLLPVLLLLAALPAVASVEALRSQARADGLAGDPQWLALLHVNRGGTLRARGESYVDDRTFFLAADGWRDPAAELDATVARVFDPADATVRCRYVARYRWLAGRLGQPVRLDDCADYLKWRAQVHGTRVTLVFPGSYLNSPSSMFGHTLLRIDPPAEQQDTVWLSWAVSFGAMTTAQDNSILYIWKGLAGGYPGLFNVTPYYEKIQDYGRLENRDLWEYPLDLTPDETGRLLDHLWEIEGSYFDYYFFDENCSYRLLELIDVARPGLDLTRQWRLAEVPVNTIRGTQREGIAGAGVLRPSAERELRARIDVLDAPERALALALSRGEAGLDDARLAALAPERRVAVVAAAYFHTVYVARKGPREASRVRHSLALVRELNASPVKPQVQVEAPPPPESGHDTRRWQLGAGSRDDTAFAQLGFRTTYHDLLDGLPGYLPGAELEMFDGALRLYDGGEVALERLQVANVFSLVPRDGFFRAWSWRIHGGLEQQFAPGGIDDVRYLEGGGGVTAAAGAWRAYALVMARLENASAWDRDLVAGAGPALGLVAQYPRLSLLLSGQYLPTSDNLQRTDITAGAQWQAGRNLGLRLEARWQDGHGDARGADASASGVLSVLGYF